MLSHSFSEFRQTSALHMRLRTQIRSKYYIKLQPNDILFLACIIKTKLDDVDSDLEFVSVLNRSATADNSIICVKTNRMHLIDTRLHVYSLCVVGQCQSSCDFIWICGLWISFQWWIIGISFVGHACNSAPF